MANNDLDKLMSKLKKTEDKTPQETEEYEEDDLEEDDLEEEDDEEDEIPAPEKLQPVLLKQKKVEEVKKDHPIPKKVEDPVHSIEEEIGLLQNDGIFRRELILTLKETNEILKIIAELSIKNLEIKRK